MAYRRTKQQTFFAAFSVVALLATLPLQAALAQQTTSWKEYKGRISTNIGAVATFHKANRILVNYRINSQPIKTGDENTEIAQIAIRMSESSSPVTMSCDIQSNRRQQVDSFADEVTSQPCIDISQAESTQLLQGGDNYIRRIRVNSAQAQENQRSNDTMVLSFSYL